MKRLILLWFLLPAAGTARLGAAQRPDSVAAAASAHDGELVVSGAFLRELENAFTLDPMAAPIPKQEELTREQLHEWVGSRDIDLTLPDSVKVKTTKYTRDYFRYKCYLNELGTVADLPKLEIPGLTTGSFAGYAPRSALILDVNHSLSYLFSPSYRLKEKMHRLAEEHKVEMMLTYPLDGETPWNVKEDEHRFWDRPGWLRQFEKKNNGK